MSEESKNPIYKVMSQLGAGQSVTLDFCDAGSGLGAGDLTPEAALAVFGGESDAICRDRRGISVSAPGVMVSGALATAINPDNFALSVTYTRAEGETDHTILSLSQSDSRARLCLFVLADGQIKLEIKDGAGTAILRAPTVPPMSPWRAEEAKTLSIAVHDARVTLWIDGIAGFEDLPLTARPADRYDVLGLGGFPAGRTWRGSLGGRVRTLSVDPLTDGDAVRATRTHLERFAPEVMRHYDLMIALGDSKSSQIQGSVPGHDFTAAPEAGLVVRCGDAQPDFCVAPLSHQSTLVGNYSSMPFFAQTLYDLTGRGTLFVPMSKGGLPLCAKAATGDGEHCDPRVPDTCALIEGRAFNENRGDTIMPMTRDRIARSPGIIIDRTCVLWRGGAADGDALLDGSLTQEEFADTLRAVRLHFGAEALFLSLSPSIGCDPETKTHFAAKIAALRKAQVFAAAHDPDIHLTFTETNDWGSPCNTITYNADHRWIAGWHLYDGSHDGPDSTRVLGVEEAWSVASRILGHPLIARITGDGGTGTRYRSTQSGQWYADGTPIPDATGQTYVEEGAGIGAVISHGQSNRIAPRRAVAAA